MRPADALDTHVLLSEICALPLVGAYIGELAQKQMRSNVDRPLLHSALRNHLAAGYTYHLDVRMADAVQHRAEGLRSTSQYGHYDPPSGCGVLVLDQPWDVSEISGRTQRTNLLTWGPIQVGTSRANTEPGYLLTLWQDTRRGAADSFTRELLADPATREVVDRFAGLYPIYVGGVAKSMRIGDYWHVVPEERAAELAAAGRPVAARLNAPLNHILATWDLMEQSLANLDDAPVQRASARRAQRAKIPPRVTVVTLRRNEHTHETGAGTPLAWRIPVREHSRHYWVRDPATGELVREKRTIETHWRGPEDAPVHVSDKVYTLRR